MKIRPPIWSQRASVSPGRCLDQLRLEAVLVGDAVELAVDAEAPGMEGAGELGDAAALVERDRIGAVRAGVVEGADAAVLLAHDHEALVAVVEDGVVAFLGDVRSHAGQQPHARPQEFPFLFHELARVVARRIRHVEAVVGLGLLGFQRPGRGTQVHGPDGLQVRSHDGNLESERAGPPEYSKGVWKRNRPDCFLLLAGAQMLLQKCHSMPSDDAQRPFFTALRLYR